MIGQRHHNKTVVAIAVDKEHIPALGNFICSARAHQIDLSNLVVFTTSSPVKEFLSNAGPAGSNGEEFMIFRDKVLAGQDDITWLKIFSVLLPLEAGFDVLFF